MQKDIQKIGNFNYFWAILTGKNKKVIEIVKKNYINNEEYSEEIIRGDFIITISKKFVILTEYKNNKRCPLIVRKWKEEKNEEDFIWDYFNSLAPQKNYKTKSYTDNKGYKWLYHSDMKNLIFIHEPNNDRLAYTLIV